MIEIFLTIFFITVLLFFLGSGIWVAVSMIGVSAIGMMLFTSRPVGDAMATTIWGTSSSWTLTALPLFVWMGEILFRTKLSENLFKGLSPWMQKLPGGLIHVNVVGCALFAAISGSSAATVATVGKMSIPELRKRNYPEKTYSIIVDKNLLPKFAKISGLYEPVDEERFNAPAKIYQGVENSDQFLHYIKNKNKSKYIFKEDKRNLEKKKNFSFLKQWVGDNFF